MKEIRSFKAGVELRSKDRPTVYGRGITFDSLSLDLGGFREKFDANGKFTLDPSFRLLWDHQTSTPLGSYKSGLKLTRKRDGIYYECPLPPTMLASDVATLIREGISDQVSFGFVIDAENGDQWDVVKGEVIRTVRSATIFEVSILGGQAAYASNTIDVRRAPKHIQAMLRDSGLDDSEDDEQCNCDCDNCQEDRDKETHRCLRDETCPLTEDVDPHSGDGDVDTDDEVASRRKLAASILLRLAAE